MRFILTCIFGLLLLGCGNSDKSTQKYSYTSANNEAYTITLSDNKIEILKDSNKIRKAIFLVFLDYECLNCEFYYEHLNHLTSTHKNLEIIGLLPNQDNAEKMQEFINANKLNFNIIAPKADSILKQILDSRLSTQDSKIIDFSRDSLAESKTESTDSTESTQQDSTLDSTDSIKAESMDSKMPKLELPFFVLYAPNGEIYQDYSGIIPEEIFSSDIKQMLN